MRLLSWNIQWGLGCDGKLNLARIANVIQAMGEVDVICLQEVAANHPALPGSTGEDQVDVLRSLFQGYSAHYGVSSDLADGRGQRRLFGNLILSRLPVLQVFRHSLPCYAFSASACMPRIALEAVVSCGDHSLRVITTHLEYYSAEQRMDQVQKLRAIHDEAFSQAQHPADTDELDAPFQVPTRPASSIYCGDFNCEPQSGEIRALLQSFASGAPALLDTWQVANPDQPNAATVGLNGCSWPDRAYCCDYFFVSEDLRGKVKHIQVNQETNASDHQPVLLELA